MSENKNSFDDLIRRKLDNEEEPASAGLWSAIEKELPVTGTKKRFAYWRLTVLLLLIGIPVSVFYFNMQHTNAELKQSEIISNNYSNLPIVSTSKKADELPKAEIQNAEKPEQVIQPQNTIAVKNKKTVRPNKQSYQTNLSVSVATVNATPALSVNENSNESTGDNSSDIQNVIENIPTLPTATASEQQTAIENADSNIAAIQNDSSAAQLKPEQAKPDSLIPQAVKSSKLFVEVFYSPDYANKSMSLNGDDESYLRIRKNTEMYFYAHSYGIRAGYKLSEKIRVKTGLDYTVVQNRLSYGYLPGQNGVPAGLKTDSVTGILINPLNNGTIITANDTTLANYELVGENSDINEYKFYNIPFIVSFTLGSKRIKWEGGAGMFLNIFSKQTGSIIGIDRISRINLKEDRERTPYKTKAGIGIATEILMSYSISHNIKFLLGPHAKFYLSKLNKNNTPVNEKLFNAGIFTGFKVEF